MDQFQQCAAIVFLSRGEGGGRGGLTAPHRCRRVALEGGEYCEIHEDYRDLQDLFRGILRPGWEIATRRWLAEHGRGA